MHFLQCFWNIMLSFYLRCFYWQRKDGWKEPLTTSRKKGKTIHIFVIYQPQRLDRYPLILTVRTMDLKYRESIILQSKLSKKYSELKRIHIEWVHYLTHYDKIIYRNNINQTSTHTLTNTHTGFLVEKTLTLMLSFVTNIGKR